MQTSSPVSELTTSFEGAIVINDLQFGVEQSFRRTDSLLGAKSAKLRWAIETAAAKGLAVVLSGKILSQVASFDDLSHVLRNNLISHASVFLMPDYDPYTKNQDRSSLAVIDHVMPGKVINTELDLAGGEIKLISSMSYESSETLKMEPLYLVFQSRKRPRRLSDHVRKAYVLTRLTEAGAVEDDSYGAGCAVRKRVTDSAPSALKITRDGIERLEIPHSENVFTEVLADIDKAHQETAQDTSSHRISISKAFDPRVERKSGQGGVVECLDKLYVEKSMDLSVYDLVKSLL